MNPKIYISSSPMKVLIGNDSRMEVDSDGSLKRMGSQSINSELFLKKGKVYEAMVAIKQHR